ncbi:hypothetical protein OG930_21885 [Streptomyces sp. NBC_01799]|uniref:hypothetical protein n=1 Tax=Streptomyces sp. NBC_01800 TaxID=2975945 RepID=UPI002DD8CD70|nr:hypothetical protein [Streptomyces sp. NBC_01800]WSA69537.1 hypothetical protein OIE65_22605 [Streptomyces sp. NBC_01800]WSA78024.1 hypothetical protein OG930_21885 [Streptomyces sp. NBC_01799]
MAQRHGRGHAAERHRRDRNRERARVPGEATGAERSAGAEQQGDARWRFCRGAGPDGGPERTWGEHVIPIPGTKTPKYLADNAGAGDVELSPADPADLDALPATEGGRY